MFKISFKRWFETNFGKEKPELTWALVILSAFKFQLLKSKSRSALPSTVEPSLGGRLFILDKVVNYRGRRWKCQPRQSVLGLLFGRSRAAFLLANFTGELAKHFPEKFAGGPGIGQAVLLE